MTTPNPDRKDASAIVAKFCLYGKITEQQAKDIETIVAQELEKASADERAKMAEPGEWERDFDEICPDWHIDDAENKRPEKLKSFIADLLAKAEADKAKAVEEARRGQIERDAEMVRGFLSANEEYARDVIRSQLTPATPGSSI